MSLPLSSFLQYDGVDQSNMFPTGFGYDNCSSTEVTSNKFLSSLSPLRKMDFALCKWHLIHARLATFPVFPLLTEFPVRVAIFQFLSTLFWIQRTEELFHCKRRRRQATEICGFLLLLYYWLKEVISLLFKLQFLFHPHGNLYWLWRVALRPSLLSLAVVEVKTSFAFAFEFFEQQLYTLYYKQNISARNFV